MEFDRAFLSTKFKASGLRDIKFNDNELYGTEFNSAHGVNLKLTSRAAQCLGRRGLPRSVKF